MTESFNVFESLATSFCLRRPESEGNWQSHTLREREQEFLPSGEVRQLEYRALWYLQESNKPTFKSFTEKINRWLIEVSHPTSPRMVNVIIEVLMHLMSKPMTLVQALDILSSKLRTANVSHFAFLPTKPPLQELSECLRFGDFLIGKLDLAPLKSRSQRAGSDFFNLYGKDLVGLPGIQSPIYKRTIFDLVTFLHKTCPNFTWDTPFYQITLRYFEALAAEHFEMTWSDFSEKKLMIEAFGCSIIEEEVLRRLPGLWKITIYLDFKAFGDAGYVVPEISSKIIGLPHLGKMQAAIESLEETYRFSELTNSVLCTLLQSVCRSVVISRRFRSEQKLNEAFLHQVIALEQVFSEKEKTTQAVGGRTAILVHRQLGLSYSDAKKLIIKLYDARSQFVHRGQKVRPELFDQIEPVAMAVVKSLIHLSHQPDSSSDDFVDNWLKRLNAVIAIFDAGMPISSEMALANGLIEADALLLP
jgi:hypothetical protein